MPSLVACFVKRHYLPISKPNLPPGLVDLNHLR